MNQKRQPLIDGEYWVDIPGYEHYYCVSNHGRVRSCPRYVKGRNGMIGNRILRPNISNAGYLGVSLCKNNVVKRFSVHRLVAMAFVNNEHGLPEVNHKDGDKLNNHWQNLEWCTRQENALHSTTILKKNVGEVVGTALLSEDQVKEIKILLSETNLSQVEIGKRFGVSNHVIHKIKHGVNWGWLDEKGIFMS